jgi:hypothetical protein
MSIEKKIGADDLISIMNESDKNVLLNTLPASDQKCLIKHTTLIDMEEFVVNTILSNRKSHKTKIIIYGRNHTDVSPTIKYRQLIRLGYDESFLYIYSGGLFEWSCLQLIDSHQRYETTSPCDNPLLHKPLSVFLHNLIS